MVSVPDFPETTLDDVRNALAFINPDLPRDEWARVGMAIKSQFDEFELFDEWSSGGGNYNKIACRDTWKSIKPGGGITIKTLFKMAVDEGWRPEKKELSDADRLRLRQEYECRKVERAERDREERLHSKKLQKASAWAVQELWQKHLTDSGKSDYLVKKRVGNHGLAFPKYAVLMVTDADAATVAIYTDKAEQKTMLDSYKRLAPEGEKTPEHISVRFLRYGVVLMPLRNDARDLVNFQALWGSGTKSFLRGAQKKGTWHSFGKPANDQTPIFIGEGYATMATIFEAKGYPCAVALDAGNLMPVSKSIRAKFPNNPIFICGDDDIETEGNPGRKAANEAATAIGGKAVFPEFKGCQQ